MLNFSVSLWCAVLSHCCFVSLCVCPMRRLPALRCLQSVSLDATAYSATGKQCVCVPPRVCMSVYSSSLMWANYKCLNPLFLNFHLMSCFSKVMKRTRTSSGTSLTWPLTTQRSSNGAAQILRLDLPQLPFLLHTVVMLFSLSYTHTHTHAGHLLCVRL